VKRVARKTLVRRWLVLAIVKIVSWLVNRLWSEKDHHNLSS
jgi:flagellar biogenesis protein FliO